MIRGAKIYGLLLLHDLWRTFLVTPKGIVGLLTGLVCCVVLLPLMMIAPREQQNKAIYHGLNSGGPDWIRGRLVDMLEISEMPWIKDISNHKGPT